MPRSFKLKFFILVSIAIVFFAVMTRFTVRGASTKPLHELLYANFASYLEVSVKDSPNQLPDLSSAASSALNVQSLQQLERRILAYYPELSAPKLQLWWGGSENDVQTALIKQVSWRKINQPDPSQAVLVAEGATGDMDWVAFKTTLENRDLFVVVPSDVFQQRFENIMVARETIVNSMWPILLFYIILVTWFLTYWVMRSLQNLQNTFKDIELKGQMKPISEKQFDIEFASFIGYFNQLIHRLQKNFSQASRFSSDAAHELRTPLTVIRGNLKRLLNRAADNSVDQIQLSMLSDEVERLISITNKLVTLSQADGDNFNIDRQPIKLFDLVAVMGEDVQSLVPHLQFEYSINPEIKILADPNLFQQLLNNLISNAIKYTPPQGLIKFNAKVFGDIVEFSMANTTYLSLDGLDDRVFHRFYRHFNSDDTSIQKPKGDGLGLSLCQEIAHAHGGTLTLHKGPGQWVTFKATWQRA
jgi:signal transduction histidine kinase